MQIKIFKSDQIVKCLSLKSPDFISKKSVQKWRKSDTFVTFQFLDHLKIINVALNICQIILKYSVIFLHLDLYFKLKCAKIKEEK